jgi:hypothetical protein
MPASRQSGEVNAVISGAPLITHREYQIASWTNAVLVHDYTGRRFIVPLFPAWYLEHHPERFIITASYGQELADDFGRRVRNLISAPPHQAIFPGCRFADDSRFLWLP